jgi:hypothetical protein
LKNKKYQFRSAVFSDVSVETELYLTYEVDLSSMTYDYSGELEAGELFNQWVKEAKRQFQNGLVPIRWLLRSRNNSMKPEYLPGTGHGDKDFYAHYFHPINVETHQSLVWEDLDVEAPTWSENKLEGAGFISVVTGWQPKVGQRFVDVDELIQMANKGVYA